jgi:hypothetical protein
MKPHRAGDGRALAATRDGLWSNQAVLSSGPPQVDACLATQHLTIIAPPPAERRRSEPPAR